MNGNWTNHVTQPSRLCIILFRLCGELLETNKLWVLRWLIGSTSVSQQCDPGSIPGWGSDPSAVSEKGPSSPVWATLRPWVGTLSHWPSLQPLLTQYGESLRCWRPVSDALITWIPADEESLYGMLLCMPLSLLLLNKRWCIMDQIRLWQGIDRFHVTSLAPCWRTITKVPH